MATIIAPTLLDLWLARELASLLRYRVEFNVGVQRAISSHVLGGLWFGLTLFLYWVWSARERRHDVQVRILTVLLGSTLAILLTLVAAWLVSWPPPVHYPGLDHLYIGLLEPNPNTNSFPSQSMALYGSIAAGIYSLHRLIGWGLWALVVLFIALPRMFVGGHFITDVVVGFILALVGYMVARYLLETRLISQLESNLDRTSRLRLFRDTLVFFWMIQVTVEFQAVVWLRNLVESLIH